MQAEASLSAAPVRPPRSGYTRAFVALHWLLAMLLLAQLALGWWMVGLPDAPRGLQAPWFNLHKSMGLTIALLVLLRLVALRRQARPAEEPGWQGQAARASHAVLYACMLLLPLTGYFGSSFSGYPVRFFGQALPQWAPAWPAGKEFLSLVHGTLVWVFAAIVALHVAAALWHWLWRRDGVAARVGLPALPRRPR